MREIGLFEFEVETNEISNDIEQTLNRMIAHEGIEKESDVISIQIRSHPMRPNSALNPIISVFYWRQPLSGPSYDITDLP